MAAQMAAGQAEMQQRGEQLAPAHALLAAPAPTTSPCAAVSRTVLHVTGDVHASQRDSWVRALACCSLSARGLSTFCSIVAGASGAGDREAAR